MDREVSPAELRDSIIGFLKQHKDGSLATVMDNFPRSSPVQYFLGEGMDIYILSAGGDKFNAIEQNPNVCLLVNTEYINYRKIKGVQVFGTATTSIMDPGLFEEAKKYCDEPQFMENHRDSLKVIKIVPKEIVYLDSIEEGDRTKQILRNNEVITREDSDMRVLATFPS